MTAVATEAAEQARQRRSSPYQGLVPYTAADVDYFFARKEWCEVVTDNLLAFRLSLFYGASGVGKSSILKAGVAYNLRRQARENLETKGRGELAVVEFSSWQGDPVAGLEEATREAIRDLSPALADDPPSGSLADVLKDGRPSSRLVPTTRFRTSRAFCS